MSDDSEKFTRIEGPSGETLIVRKPKRQLVDLLPPPRDAAREIMDDGLDDSRVNDPWVRGHR